MMIVSVDCYWYEFIILNALALKYQGNEAGNASKCFFNMRLSPILIRAKRQSWRIKVRYARVRVRRPTSLVAKPSKASAVFLVLYCTPRAISLNLQTIFSSSHAKPAGTTIYHGRRFVWAFKCPPKFSETDLCRSDLAARPNNSSSSTGGGTSPRCQIA